MWDRTCPGVPGVETGMTEVLEVDTRHFQGYSTMGTRHIQGRDRQGEAHSRGGCAWLPGTVGHGHSGRVLEQKPAKVRGFLPATPMGTAGRSPGGPSGGG